MRLIQIARPDDHRRRACLHQEALLAGSAERHGFYRSIQQLAGLLYAGGNKRMRFIRLAARHEEELLELVALDAVRIQRIHKHRLPPLTALIPRDFCVYTFRIDLAFLHEMSFMLVNI